jgi:hypothetical protein
MAQLSSPRLLVVTAELARKPLGAHWERVVVCDWTRVLKILGGAERESVNLLPCDAQIALVLADRADAGQFTEAGLGLLLGVAPLQLGCPAAAKDLLCERTLRVEDSRAQSRSRVCHYGTLRLEAPSDEEREESGQRSSYDSALAALLGPLRTAGRSVVPRLPKGTTAERFFLQSDPELSDFARGSFREKCRVCAICMRESGVTAVTRCGHWFCARCIERVLGLGRQCPVCRRALPAPAAVQVREPGGTTYLCALSRLLREGAGRRLLVCSFGNCLERVARFLREHGSGVFAWSGNARQLMRNLEDFGAHADGVLLCDPEFLPVHLLHGFAQVGAVLCLLPLNVERREVCCQLRAILSSAPHARLTFVRCSLEARLPLEKPECGCSNGDCPFLIQN